MIPFKTVKYASTRDWSGFTPAGAKTMVGFDPASKELIIQRGANGYTGHLYNINLLNGAIAYGQSLYATARRSNFVNDHLGQLLCLEAVDAANVTVEKWDHDPQVHADCVVAFRDEDLGVPERNQYVYGADVRYISTVVDDQPLRYLLNGSFKTSPSSWTEFNDGVGGPDFAIKADWFDSYHTIGTKQKCKSFRLMIFPATSGKYEIAKASIDARILPASR